MANNLWNVHSFKHSGLANRKIVTTEHRGKDPTVLQLQNSVMKEFPRMVKAVVNLLADNYYRIDWKKAALSRLIVVSRSSRLWNLVWKRGTNRPVWFQDQIVNVPGLLIWEIVKKKKKIFKRTWKGLQLKHKVELRNSWVAGVELKLSKSVGILYYIYQQVSLGLSS